MTKTDDSDGAAWVELFDASTTREELSRIVDRQTQIALADVRGQLDAMTDASARDKQAMLAAIAPVVEARTRRALASGWQRLQLEASLDRGTIH